MQNEECVQMGYCFEKENIPNPKCYMKKGSAGKRYESSIKMTSMFGKELGKSISQIQCSLKCTLDENCVDVVFKPTSGNKGNCYVATGDHVSSADHAKSGYIIKSVKP
ncbi:uncharacterized protein LOC130644505 [Hydractinia symbiolongicarpus]|uniref:uncharacterized protein LOC130644505 n=1 Tax=Hydractinia symbiolongicarpus TaxID=13093 RepID=UPI00254E0550|nr:uncharacterized protein LOC130644505 [Hydractinia symbiolongicarpus]